MECAAGLQESGNAAGDRPLHEALAMRSKLWREPATEIGMLEAGWVTAADLFDDSGAIDDLLEYQASFTKGLDQKGRAAYLITEYSYMFAITTVPLLVGHGIVPDFSAANYAILFETRPIVHDGRTIAERRARVRFLSHACRTDRESAATSFDPTKFLDRPSLRAYFRHSVEDHFHPLIEQLHGKSRLSRNALWRLVADSLAALFLDAGQRYQCEADALHEALAILKAAGSPLNNRQMHYFDVTVRDGGNPAQVLLTRTFRARGGCCRFYTADGGHLCSTCVLKDPVERDQGLLEGMRRRLGLPAGQTAVASQAQPR